MSVYLQNVVEYYHLSMESGDPRTSSWLFMSTPWPTIGIVFVYILVVVFGPKLMNSRQSFDLRGILIVYNCGLVLLSLYMLIEYILSIRGIPNFNYWCDGVEYVNDAKLLRYSSVNWLFYISKLVELFDTFFFILRKKPNQISFLHVYHHSSMCMLWWTVVKWTSGGTSYFGASLNCFVHVVMYTYYMLSAFGPQYRKYLWWKKYLTSLQLLQFMALLIYIQIALRIPGCGFPRWTLWLFFFYSISLIVLFSMFFFHEYIKKGRTKTLKKVD